MWLTKKKQVERHCGPNPFDPVVTPAPVRDYSEYDTVQLIVTRVVPGDRVAVLNEYPRTGGTTDVIHNFVTVGNVVVVNVPKYTSLKVRVRNAKLPTPIKPFSRAVDVSEHNVYIRVTRIYDD